MKGPRHEKPLAGLRYMSGVMGGDPGGRVLGRAPSITVSLAEANLAWRLPRLRTLETRWMGILVHPYTVTPVQVGVDFRKIGAWLSPSNVVMS